MVKIYISFKGNCNDALNFYKNCFNSEYFISSTYGDIDPNCSEGNKNLVLHSEMEIEGTTFIFNDYLDENMVVGNNFSILIQTDKSENILKYYNILKKDGIVNIELGSTEFSDLYANITDKYGVSWIIMK